LKTRIVLTLICIALLASGARAQTTAAGRTGASAKAETSPVLEEAARLTEEVVKLYAARKYEEALPLAERVVELREKELGRAHTLVAGALVNLAAVELNLNMLEEAKGHYRRAASAFEKAGDEAVKPLINALEGQARLEPDVYSAVELHKRVLALKEKAYGPDAPELARTLFPLGHLNDLLGRRDESERYFQRFVEVASKNKAGAEDDVAAAYLRLACLADRAGKHDEAMDFKLRAEAAFKNVADKLAPLEGGVINGKAISKPQPIYPAEAKRASAEGVVEVEMLIGENGAVLSACARGDAHASLKAASEFAAYNALFTPTLLKGKPVKVRGIITYRFVLR
jgi:tetratricopeptide (TPR) repeat protein